MSGLIPITVSTPPGEEAHIRAEDDASVYLSLFGGDGVSTNGQSCKATVLSNNKVRIADGIICVGGHFARIPYGDYIDCEIENGQSGKNRNDIIVARFETTGTGGIDTYTCEVKKGTAGSTATDPEIVQEDLYKAGKVRELPLYRVKIEGLSITAVEQLFTLRKTNEELEKELAELNSNILKSLMPYKVGYKVLAIPVANATSIKVLSISEINKLFGVTDASSGNTMAMFANGNGDNQPVHVEGATYKDDYWFAIMDSGALKQDIQINYVVWYFGSQTPTSNNTGTAKMQKKTATPTQTTQVVTPDTGYDGLSSVTVSAIPYEESDGEFGGTTVNIG